LCHHGRFLREDPLSFSAGDTNLYRYVLNVPSFLRDPTGLTVRGRIVGGGFAFVMGGFVYIADIWDEKGNRAQVLLPRASLGVDIGVGVERVLSQGTVPEFINGQTFDGSVSLGIVSVSVGYTTGCGWSFSWGFTVPWVPEWPFKVGVSVGWTPVVGVIWKNF